MKHFLTFIAFVLSSSLSHCCTCIGDVTVREEVKRSDVIVIGKVLSKKILTITDSIFPTKQVYFADYSVYVLRNYKGKTVGNTIRVVSGVGGGDCGFEFETGGAYIIYCSYKDRYYPLGDGVDRFLYTNICRRTKEATNVSEVKAVEKYCKKIRRIWWWCFSNMFR